MRTRKKTCLSDARTYLLDDDYLMEWSSSQSRVLIMLCSVVLCHVVSYAALKCLYRVSDGFGEYCVC
jgi:hypothetical protein